MKTNFEITKKNIHIVMLRAENHLLKKIIKVVMKKKLNESKTRFKSVVEGGTAVFNKLPSVKQVGVYATFTA